MQPLQVTWIYRNDAVSNRHACLETGRAYPVCITADNHVFVPLCGLNASYYYHCHSNNSLYKDKATTRAYALLAQLHGVCVLLLARLSIVLHSPSTQSRTPTTTRMMLDTSPTVIFQLV